MDFSEYQEQATRTDQNPGDGLKEVMVPLLGLAGETGTLLTEYKKWLRDGDRYTVFTDQVSEELGDILWYVSTIASRLNLNLNEIAEENLAKVLERWPNNDEGQGSFFKDLNLYDAHFPEAEQLPKSIEVFFQEVKTDGKIKLKLTYNGSPLGDPLTDNSYIDDGYRFHDVFHFTNAIMLGWSPVIRKLLRCKRKSVPRVDEVEDGARAALTEEGISAFVFTVAKEFKFFEGAEAVDYEILNTIKVMTRPYEVRNRSMGEWQTSILSAYNVWRKMKDNSGGVLVGDYINREVTYRELPKDSQTSAANPKL